MQIGLGSNEFKTLRGREWSKFSPVLPVQKTAGGWRFVFVLLLGQ